MSKLYDYNATLGLYDYNTKLKLHNYGITYVILVIKIY